MSTEKHFSTGKQATAKLMYRTLVKSLFIVDQLCEFNSDEMKQNQPILFLLAKKVHMKEKKQFFKIKNNLLL